jgi:hypothetical protein
MQETLEALELERTKLYQQLQALGDFRPGIIFGQLSQMRQAELRFVHAQVTRGTDPNTCGIPRRGAKPGTEFTYGSGVGKGPKGVGEPS